MTPPCRELFRDPSHMTTTFSWFNRLSILWIWIKSGALSLLCWSSSLWLHMSLRGVHELLPPVLIPHFNLNDPPSNINGSSKQSSFLCWTRIYLFSYLDHSPSFSRENLCILVSKPLAIYGLPHTNLTLSITLFLTPHTTATIFCIELVCFVWHCTFSSLLRKIHITLNSSLHPIASRVSIDIQRMDMFDSGSHQKHWLWKLMDLIWLMDGFCLFRATPVAYGSSQVRGWIRAAAANLHHNHSNLGSEVYLWPTP